MPIPETRAQLSLVGQDHSFPVHFNPESLQYTIANTLKEGKGKKAKQHVAQSTGKLSMDLIFDTTHDGKDVRVHTNALAKLMEPTAKGKKKFPVVAKFEWGSYEFQGMVESYQETIDFFASNGVPLRATVKIALAQQDKVFQSKTAPPVDTAPQDDVAAMRTSGGGPPQDPGGPDTPKPDPPSVTDVATQAGDANAWRDIATANNIENPRFLPPGTLIVDASVSGTGAAGFSAGGSASAGISVAGTIGAGASAGVSASAGAFAGLRAGTAGQAGGTLDASALLPTPPSVSVGGELSAGIGIGGDVGIGSDVGIGGGIGVGAGVSLGGQASAGGSASLKADVGLNVSLRDRIQFDTE